MRCFMDRCSAVSVTKNMLSRVHSCGRGVLMARNHKRRGPRVVTGFDEDSEA